MLDFEFFRRAVFGLGSTPQMALARGNGPRTRAQVRKAYEDFKTAENSRSLISGGRDCGLRVLSPPVVSNLPSPFVRN